MGFLDKAIRRGIGRAVETAVADKVLNVVAPKAKENLAKNTADMNAVASSIEQVGTSFVNGMAQNLKVCPSCGAPASAQTKFCQNCGTQLQEETISAGFVCPSCGKQNSIGVKFCTACGTKLPSTVVEEQAQHAKDEAVLASWENLLPQYPKWSYGGRDISIEAVGTNADGASCYALNLLGVGDNEVHQYRALLKQNGFTEAGKFPSESMLYKMIDGTCYYFESAEPFASEYMSVSFGVGEPEGGFSYRQPEKKKPLGFKELFNL